jgi:hypothetical protein
VSKTLAFESCLLKLKVFRVDVLKVLWWFTLYSTIGRPEINKENKINKIE